MNKKGKITKAAVAVPSLACNGFLGGASETFYDDFIITASTLPRWSSTINNPPLATTAAAAIARNGLVTSGTTQLELFKHARTVFNKGGINRLLIELCASDSSRLTQIMPHRAAAIRVTQQTDLTNNKAVRVPQDMKLACKLRIRLVTWASMPCTVGCSWRHINAAKGITTGDVALTGTLVRNIVKLCKFNKNLCGLFCWELPEKCDLWKDLCVEALVRTP